MSAGFDAVQGVVRASSPSRAASAASSARNLLIAVTLGLWHSACVVPLEVLTRLDAGPAPLTGVTDVSAGVVHSCAIANGRLACWGANGSGQLGAPPSDPQLPRWVDSATDWVQVRAADHSTCAKKSDGSVWCWGLGNAGQLGNGSFDGGFTPVRVPLPSAPISFEFKYGTACVVFTGGSAACWGANAEGQVGLEDVPFLPDQPSPRTLKQGGWAQLATGQGHTCGVRTDGSLYCWGRNTDGELGLGAGAGGQQRTVSRVGTDSDWVEVSCGLSTTCARKRDASLWCWGSPQGSTASNVPVQIAGTPDWQQLSLNVFVRGGLRANGTWSNWGRNVEGQLGTGDFDAHDVEPVTSGSGYSWLSTGWFHACAVKNGQAFCTGDNPVGQLGTGTGRLNTPTVVLEPASH